MVAKITLKPGREAPAIGGNPWIFSGAIERREPAAIEAGSMVEVRSTTGRVIGCGYYNGATTIAVRMLWWGDTPALDEIISRRLESALAMRRRIIADDTDCYRLLNGDGDGL